VSAIGHHPPDEALATFAAGTLPEGEALVVATHLEACAECREWVGTLEAVGGILLNDNPPRALATAATRDTLARLTEAPVDGELMAKTAPPAAPADMPGLPAVLRYYRLGPWETVGPGMESRQIVTSTPSRAPVVLIRLAPGIALEPHGHEDHEWICVLEGAFHDEHGRYGAGDFVSADPGTTHAPIADPQVGCLCLVVGR